MKTLYSTGPLENGAFTMTTRTHAVHVNVMNNSHVDTAHVTLTVWDLGTTPKAVVETQTAIINPLATETVTVPGLEGVARFEVQITVADASPTDVLIGVFGATVDDDRTVPVPIHRLTASELTSVPLPFTPPDIPGLIAWYDADRLTLNEGDPVPVWPDASGNGHDARQDDPRFQPTFRTAILNDRPVVEFKLDFLRTSPFPESEGQPLTVFAVWRLIDNGISGAAAYRRVFDGTGFDFGLEWRSTVPTGVRMAAPQGIVGVRGPVDTFVANCCVFDTMDSELYEDRTLRASGNTGSNPLDGITIGARHNDARKMVGQIAELIFYGRRLSESEREQIERYLLAKWGIAVPNGVEPPLHIVYSTGALENGAFNPDARTDVVFVNVHNNDPVYAAQATVTVFNLASTPKAPLAPPETVSLAPLQTHVLPFPGTGSVSSFEVEIEVAGVAPEQVLVGVFGGVAPFGPVGAPGGT